MKWEWVKPVDGGTARFTVWLRKAYKRDTGAFLGFSVTMIDAPHNEEPTETKTMFPDIGAAFKVTAPLIPELRADGWQLIPEPHTTG